MAPRGMRIGSGESLDNEELHGLNHIIVRVIKSRRFKWAEYAARKEKLRAFSKAFA